MAPRACIKYPCLYTQNMYYRIARGNEPMPKPRSLLHCSLSRRLVTKPWSCWVTTVSMNSSQFNRDVIWHHQSSTAACPDSVLPLVDSTLKHPACQPVPVYARLYGVHILHSWSPVLLSRSLMTHALPGGSRCRRVPGAQKEYKYNNAHGKQKRLKTRARPLCMMRVWTISGGPSQDDILRPEDQPCNN